MSVVLGDTAPYFEAETAEGRIRFRDWTGDSWPVLIKPGFGRRDVKVIGLSGGEAADHRAWARDIEQTHGHAPDYPVTSDAGFHVSTRYGMRPAGTCGDPASRTPADNDTVPNVFVIGPDKKVKPIPVYPVTTGRNFDEVPRVIGSLQLTAKHKVATPVNWHPGEEVIIAGSVSDDEARRRHPEGWRGPGRTSASPRSPDNGRRPAQRAYWQAGRRRG